MSDYVIGVDLGGTRLRSALLNPKLEILNRHEVLTLADQGVEKTLPRVLDAIRATLPEDKSQVSGIGISIPGPTNPFTGTVELGTNLKGWHGIELAKIVQDELGIKTYLGNDANVAALAETALGAAHGYHHVIFITVSTGIGSGVIIDGRMLLGKEGYAGEVGHIQMVVGDKVTTLEKEAAGPALARQARERVAAGEKSSMLELAGGDISAISGATLSEAAKQGDWLALKIVERAGLLLGLGVTSLLHIFNPEVVVFGGSVSFGLGELLFAPMREAVRSHVIDDGYFRNVRYEMAALGENVSIIGAGALVVTHGGVDDVTEVAAKLTK
ncbi:MAG: ROK family protein [Anaerolineae bacterium]|nr:ROK family protein [Anaerolineae bacterium]